MELVTKPKYLEDSVHKDAFHKKLVDINCVDCGKKRKVYAQDVHQVKRCRPCQHRHRLNMRKVKNVKPRKASKPQVKGQPRSKATVRPKNPKSRKTIVI